MIEKIISGGQTGVDRWALEVARDICMPHGGMMPLGWVSLDGPHPEFEELYGLTEHPSSDLYPPRTRKNVINSDGTLALAINFESPGELLTKRACLDTGKPYMGVDVPQETTWRPPDQNRVRYVGEWALAAKIVTLNVAGNSHMTFQAYSLDFESWVKRFLTELFMQYGRTW